MKTEYVRRILIPIILATICMVPASSQIMAQQARQTSPRQNRVGQITVNNTVNNKSAVVSQAEKKPTANQPEADQLARLSELTPPPRPSTTGRPAPQLAEPAPQMAQQSSRTNTAAPAANTTNAAANQAADKAEVNATTENATSEENTQQIREAMNAYHGGNIEQAKSLLEKLYRANSDFPPPGIFFAQFAADSQQSNQLRYWLDQVTWEHPDDPEAYFLLADFALMESRLTETRLLVENGLAALEKLPENGERRRSITILAESVQGRFYQMREQWNIAREHFEKLIVMQPENSDILARLGYIAVQQEKYDDAIAFYEKANAKGAKLPAPKLIVSQIADQSGKTDVAKKYFDEVMTAADLDPESIRIAVQIQLRHGDIDEADKFLTKAAKAEPNNIDNLILAGAIALFKKDYSTAEKQFQDAVLINPNNYEAVHGLALTLAELDGPLKKDRALAYAKNNVQNSGESSDSVATLAWVYFKSDKIIEAEYLVNVVLSTGDVSPLNAYFLAEISAAAGQKDKALSLVKIANSSKNAFMKKEESLALQKKLESELDAPAPLQTTEPQTDSPSESTTTKPSVRIPATR